MKQNTTLIGTTSAGERVYVTRDGIVTKPRRKPPWHTTIVILLVELHSISPADYESYRRGDRDLSEIFLDSRLPYYPTWVSLHEATAAGRHRGEYRRAIADGDRRYRFKPVERYFETADELVRRQPGGQP